MEFHIQEVARGQGCPSLFVPLKSCISLQLEIFFIFCLLNFLHATQCQIICAEIFQVKKANFNSDPFLQAFGISVSSQMVDVTGRILPVPKLQYGGRVSRNRDSYMLANMTP